MLRSAGPRVPAPRGGVLRPEGPGLWVSIAADLARGWPEGRWTAWRGVGLRVDVPPVPRDTSSARWWTAWRGVGLWVDGPPGEGPTGDADWALARLFMCIGSLFLLFA